MKNLFTIISLFLIASAIYGCSKGNPKNITPVTTTTSTAAIDSATKQSLVGKWYITNDTLRETTNGVVSLFNVYVPKANQYYFIFNADGSWSESSAATAFYAIKGKTITFNHPAQTSAQGGGTIVPAYTQKAYIRSITSTDMVLFFNDTTITSKGNTAIDYEVLYMHK